MRQYCNYVLHKLLYCEGEEKKRAQSNYAFNKLQEDIKL